MLPSMGLQRVRHNLATEQQQQQRGKVECPRAWLLNTYLSLALRDYNEAHLDENEHQYHDGDKND